MAVGIFVRFFRSNQGPQLEAKVMDCRSPSQLAKADLPSTSCDWKMFMSMDGFFRGSLKWDPLWGKTKLIANVAGNFEGFPCQNRALLVGVIFHDLCFSRWFGMSFLLGEGRLVES